MASSNTGNVAYPGSLSGSTAGYAYGTSPYGASAPLLQVVVKAVVGLAQPGYSFGIGGGVKPFQTPSMMNWDIVASPLRGAFL
ncbi:MAG: hypothetical protein V3S24_21680 [Candidatus Tectomicrobia bacterium]